MELITQSVDERKGTARSANVGEKSESPTAGTDIPTRFPTNPAQSPSIQSHLSLTCVSSVFTFWFRVLLGMGVQLESSIKN